MELAWISETTRDLDRQGFGGLGCRELTGEGKDRRKGWRKE